MKHIKNFKLFETGEWPSGLIKTNINNIVDLKYCEENPDDNCEECVWINWLKEQLECIIDDLDNKDILKIIDIRGFDNYNGPYAFVKIFNKKFKIWTSESDNLMIENFYINNNDDDDFFIGDWSKISDIINEIYSVGGPEIFINMKNFNV